MKGCSRRKYSSEELHNSAESLVMVRNVDLKILAQLHAFSPYPHPESEKSVSLYEYALI
jgi:hypothetical protein